MTDAAMQKITRKEDFSLQGLECNPIGWEYEGPSGKITI